VHSYLGVGNVIGEDEAPKVKVNKNDYKVDLRLLNAELNASAHSDNSIVRLKQKIVKEKVPKGKLAVVLAAQAKAAKLA